MTTVITFLSHHLSQYICTFQSVSVIVVEFERRKSVRTSMFLAGFWILCSTTYIIRFRSAIIRQWHVVRMTKRIPCCHSSGQSCPGESGPIPRRAFRRAWEWDLTSRCNRLRCPLARMSGLQCFNMGHNGHGINLYGVSMTLMGN